MEKIGNFSKRCEVTIKALRWYDKLGLLMPDYIDKFTGYRYYSMEKVAEMQRITELKDIGFSLEEIKQFCSAEKDDKKYNFIWQKRQELEKLTEETAQKLQRLTEMENKLSTEKKGEEKMNHIVAFNNEFVNDERVIGRWEVVKSKNMDTDKYDETFFNEIYFLPDGEKYWAFSWTKNYVKLGSGDNMMLCRYEIKEVDGKEFMFMKYDEDVIVLKQTDNKSYTKHEITQQDNINLPFVNDEKVLGKWVSVDFVKKIDNFSPFQRSFKDELFYKSAEFLPNGELLCGMGKGSYKHKWTKDTTLKKAGDGTHAPAYEIHKFDNKDYLFIEWKSGDYIWGKIKPHYYVFTRDVK